MDMSLNELQKMVKNKEAWRAAVHGAAKSQTWLSNWMLTPLLIVTSYAQREDGRSSSQSLAEISSPETPNCPQHCQPALWNEQNLFYWLCKWLQTKIKAGLPWWLSGKELTCQCRRYRFSSWVRTIPWRRKWQPTPVFLPGKSHEQRSLVGFSLWGCKKSDTT